MMNYLKKYSKSVKSDGTSHEVEISPSIIFHALLILGTAFFLFYVRNILIILFLSLIIMVALHPAVNKFNKKFKFPRGLSIAFAYTLFIALFVSLILLIAPPLVSELIGFLKLIDIPFFQEQINNIELNLDDISGLIGQIGTSFNFIVSAITSTFSGVFMAVTLFIMSIYMMVDRPNFHKKIAWFTKDPKHFLATKTFLDDLEGQLGGWVRGQAILMLTIAVATYIGLSLLKVPFALPLAVLSGLLEILPNLGPFISAVPAVIIALITFGPGMAGIVILLYIVIQQLENNILVPKIMKANAKVNPLISIVAILTGLEVAGIAGAILAIPIYIIFRAFYSAWRNRSI